MSIGSGLVKKTATKTILSQLHQKHTFRDATGVAIGDLHDDAVLACLYLRSDIN